MRKGLKRITRNNIRLFHVSTENHDGKVFHPRVPQGCYFNEDLEDTKIRRVCFSSTISGAYRAITFTEEHGEECYIHVPENIEPILKRGGVYKPSTDLVWDAKFTNEYWVRRPVKMKCIGKAKFYYNNRSTFFRWRPPVKIKWIEKY